MAKKSIASRLNAASRLSVASTDGFSPVKLDPEQIKPSEDNFYPIEEIEELADDMLLVGLLEPIVVAKLENGENMIISGHRRREACLLNKKRGHAEFSEVDCRVKEMSRNMFMVSLISGNAHTRQLSDAVLVEQAAAYKKYLTKLIEEDGVELPGRMRDYIAESLGVSRTKVAQIESINNNLSEEGKKALRSGQMNFSKAYETSRLPEKKQHDVILDNSLLSADVKAMAQSMVNGDKPEQKKVAVSVTVQPAPQEIEQGSQNQQEEEPMSLNALQEKLPDLSDFNPHQKDILFQETRKYRDYFDEEVSPLRYEKYKVMAAACEYFAAILDEYFRRK